MKRNSVRGWLADRILLAVASGSALAACNAGRTVGVGSESGAGEETGPTGGEAESEDDESTGSSSDSTSTSGDGDGGDDEGTMEPKFDIGGLPDVGPDADPDPPVCVQADGPGDWECEDHSPSYSYMCLEAPTEGGQSCADYGDEQVRQELDECIGESCTFVFEVACGPDPGESEACCYFAQLAHVCPGRPFVVAGEARLATLVCRDDWAEDMAVAVLLTPCDRQAIADAWAEQGRFEHASVASFARFVLQLLSVGAPAELVAQAQQAVQDELRHATCFFGLASAYADRPIGPGALDVEDGMGPVGDLAEIAAATAAEGCIAETISALQLLATKNACDSPALRRRLQCVLDEELRHVDLAWAFVRWAVERGGEQVRRRVAEVFGEAEQHVARGAQLDERLDAQRLRAHGHLPMAEREEIAIRGLRDIVRPCAQELLSRRAAEPRLLASV